MSVDLATRTIEQLPEVVAVDSDTMVPVQGVAGPSQRASLAQLLAGAAEMAAYGEGTVSDAIDQLIEVMPVNLLQYISRCTHDYQGQPITVIMAPKSYDWAPAMQAIAADFSTVSWFNPAFPSAAFASGQLPLKALELRAPGHRIYMSGGVTFRNLAINIKGVFGEATEFVDTRTVGVNGHLETNALIQVINDVPIGNFGGSGHVPLHTHLADISVKSKTANGTGIHIQYDNSFCNFRPLVHIRRVVVGSLISSFNAGFRFPIRLSGCWSTSLHDVYIEGDPTRVDLSTGALPFYSYFGVLMENSPQEAPFGPNAERGKVGHDWRRVSTYAVQCSFRFDGHFEGFYLFGGDHVGIGDWVQLAGRDNANVVGQDPSPGNPAFHFIDCQVDFRRHGIDAANSRSIIVLGGFFLKNGSYMQPSDPLYQTMFSVAGAFFRFNRCPGSVVIGVTMENSHIFLDFFSAIGGVRGVQAIDSAACVFSDNIMKGVMSYGYELARSPRSTITGGTMFNVMRGIILRDQTRYCNVGAGLTMTNCPTALPVGPQPTLNLGVEVEAGSFGNTIHTPAGDDSFNLPIVDSDGGNRIIRQGLAGAVRALTDNSATPAINQLGAELLLASNTAATLITDFMGGFDGMLIGIKATNGNTTIVHDPAKIKTSTGANIVMLAGQTLRFRKFGAVWEFET